MECRKESGSYRIPKKPKPQKRPVKKLPPQSKPSYIPTPRQIAAMCRKFQEGWNEVDEWKRLGKPEQRFAEPPLVAVAELEAACQE